MVVAGAVAAGAGAFVETEGAPGVAAEAADVATRLLSAGAAKAGVGAFVETEGATSGFAGLAAGAAT